MKRILLMAIAFVLLASPVIAAPFLVCDPQTGVDHYKLTGPVWVPTTSIAQPDGSIHMDVAGATVGSNSLTVAACKNDITWGELCSSTVPFVFTRPASPVSPSGIGLQP